MNIFYSRILPQICPSASSLDLYELSRPYLVMPSSLSAN